MREINIKRDLVYGHGGGRALRCDVYTPTEGSAHPLPCVLLLHGGGWSAGDRGMMRDFGERLAAGGFVCVAPEYRLTGEAPWPAQIEDVQAAVRWCRSRAAELGIDATKIAAMGFSAGAHLALLAAGMASPHPGPLHSLTNPLPEGEGIRGEGDGSDPVNLPPPALGEGRGEGPFAAVVAVYAPVLFYTGETRPSGATPAKTLLGEAASEDAARAASPLTYVGSGFPPTFLMHGTADSVVPPSASRVFYDALVQAGVPAELHLYAGQPHGFARRPDFVDLVVAEAAHFLKRQLAPIAAVEPQPQAAGRGVA